MSNLIFDSPGALAKHIFGISDQRPDRRWIQAVPAGLTVNGPNNIKPWYTVTTRQHFHPDLFATNGVPILTESEIILLANIQIDKLKPEYTSPQSDKDGKAVMYVAYRAQDLDGKPHCCFFSEEKASKFVEEDPLMHKIVPVPIRE